MSTEKNYVDVSKLTFENLNKVRLYLAAMIKAEGSDLHIKANSIIRMRNKQGLIQKFEAEIFSSADALLFAKELLKGRFGELVENKEIDLIYQYDEKYRFRVNVFFQVDGVSAVFRTIPVEAPSMDDYIYPEVLKSLIQKRSGLVLVTGATGSGKSTTLAALLNEINKTQAKHIITIEEPVEFIHKDKACIINQRSVGQDTRSFDLALRAALREDPDIIMVGEMRDKETINLAMHAADTGHLVLSTLHTIDATETINRIIAQFPVLEQDRVRLALSSVLQGIISQKIIPTADGNKRAVVEVLIKTPRIEKLIKENRDHEIIDAIESGREHYKSQSFDQAILDLFHQGIISKTEAKNYAKSASDMELRMSGLLSGNEQSFEKQKDMKTSQNDIFELK